MNQIKTILVFGGTGFIGSSLVPKLVAKGLRVLLVTRRLKQARELQTLPTVEVIELKSLTPDTVAPLIQRSQAVINLVGILHGRHGKKPEPDLDNDPRYRPLEDPYGPDFGAAHVELPKMLANLALAHNVKRFIHVSAFGTHLPKAKLPSMYLRSKAAGERAISGLPGLHTTIFRPSVVFGEHDKFLNMFASMQKLPIVLPLARGGCKFQPVYVEDLTHAITNSLENILTFGKTYDMVGPEIFTLAQIVRLSGRYAGHQRPIIPIPDLAGRFQALVLEMLPGPTLMSEDNFNSLSVDNALSEDYQWPVELGVTPHALTQIAPTYLSDSAPRFSVERAKARR